MGVLILGIAVMTGAEIVLFAIAVGTTVLSLFILSLAMYIGIKKPGTK